MPFFAPWMLLGLVVAGVPLLLHLLRKRTADRMRWGAWRFLAESMQKRHRQLQVEDWLLLALRTLVLALAAFAFARPFLPEFHFFGGGMDKDVVLVFDASASMRLTGSGGQTVFENALAEARDLIDRAPRGTAFGLVVGDSTPAILTPSPLSSKRDVLARLENLKAGHGTMDAPRTLAAAGEVLAAGNSPAKEVVIFGDGQGYGWRPDERPEWKRVERLFSRYARRPPVVWRTLERPPHVKNAAIAGVVPSRRLIGTDRPVTFSVTVANAGSEAFSPGDATLSVDGAETVRAPAGQILPSLARTFAFPCAFTNAGRHTVVAALSAPDDIASDSVVTTVVDVVESLDVVLVNGAPAAKGFARPTAFLEAALRPELKGTNAVLLVRPRTVRAAELERPQTISNFAAVVLCDVPFLSPKALTNLTDYVARGGGLVTVAGPRSATPFYTNAVFGCAATNFAERVKGVSVLGAPVIARAEYDETGLPKGADVTERFSDGAAAVIATRFGRGRVAAAAFPFTLDHTALPARPAFVPFVHDLVASVAGTNSVTADGDVAWRAKEGDLSPLRPEQLDALAPSVDLGVARTADDTLAAVLGRSFGVEISRPLAVVVLLLLVTEILFCRRLDATRGGRIRSRTRFALRLVAFAALAWMLSHAVWTHDVTRTIHRRVAVFTDRSRSMTLEDAAGRDSTNRVARLVLATNEAARIERELSGNYDVESFDFGGEATDFAAPLERALARIPGEELAGAVFVTDGRATADALPDAAARRFARLGAKIRAFVVGSVSNGTDVALESVVQPENVFLGDRVTPSVRLRADGLDGQKLTVRFLEGEREIEKREIAVKGASYTNDMRFATDPGVRGVKRYRIVVDPPAGDLLAQNNAWPFDVSVSDDRTHVLLADRRPRWEFRYLRNLFHARDKSVRLQYVLTEPDLTAGAAPEPLPAADAARPFGDSEAGALPSGREAWRKFEVIILGDLGRDRLDDAACADLKYCVEERGALLVLIAGRASMPAAFAQTSLAALLPVVVTNDEGAVTAKWKDGRTTFALTPSGASHPVSALAASASESERIWNALPPARGRLAGVTVKPGSEVLVYASGETALTAPLVVIRETGRGKVALFLTDETWLLRYRIGDTRHHRFWGNVVKWGAGEKLRDGNDFARAGTDRLHYEPGTPVKIAVRLTDRERMPLTGLRPKVEVKGPKGVRRVLDLTPREGSNGYYETSFEGAETEGEWEVAVLADEAEERLGGDFPKPLVTRFAVDRGMAPLEYARPTADLTAVAALARITGGEAAALDPSKPADLREAFGKGRTEVTEHVEDAIWDHPLALALFLLALVATWILRKRKGLA